MRATLDWSWDLLDSRERTVLSRLSVFVADWAEGQAVTLDEAVALALKADWAG